MIEDDWTLVDHTDTWLDDQGAGELRPAPGKRQFVNKIPGKIDDDDEPNQMMLLSEGGFWCRLSKVDRAWL